MITDWGMVSKQISRISAAVSLKMGSWAEAEVSTDENAIARLGQFRVSLEQIEFWQGGEHIAMTFLYQRKKMIKWKIDASCTLNAKSYFNRWYSGLLCLCLFPLAKKSLT